MKEPKDMILPMLKEMRAEVAALRARMDERFEFEERIEQVEKYGERVEKLKSKVRAFEGRS